MAHTQAHRYTRERRNALDIRHAYHEELQTLVISYDRVSHSCRDSGQVLRMHYEVTANNETIFAFDDSMDASFAYETYRKTLASIGYTTQKVF